MTGGRWCFWCGLSERDLSVGYFCALLDLDDLAKEYADDVEPYELGHCLNERLIDEWVDARIQAARKEADASRDDLTDSDACEPEHPTKEGPP